MDVDLCSWVQELLAISISDDIKFASARLDSPFLFGFRGNKTY